MVAPLTTVSLYRRCLSYLEGIQLSCEEFGQDFEKYHLTFLVARIRLLRWGEAAGLETDSRYENAPSEDTKAVYNSFDFLNNALRHTTIAASEGRSLSFFAEADIIEFRGLHDVLVAMARDKRPSVSPLVLPLHNVKRFDYVVRTLRNAFEELENVMPINELPKSENEELGKIKNTRVLCALEQAALPIDKLISRAARSTLAAISEPFIEVILPQAGNWARGYRPQQSVNVIGDVDVRGGAKVHIGGRFKYRDVFY